MSIFDKERFAHRCMVDASRRQFLQQISGLCASAYWPRALAPMAGLGAGAIMPNAYGAEPYDGKFVIFCTFEGGWDQLLAADPRDAKNPRYGAGKTINPGYNLIKESDTQLERVVDEVTGGTGVYQPEGSNLTVGPAMYSLAKDHWQDLCVVRGLDMGTLTHAVGRRYFLTGKFPRGLQASGASLVTAAAAGFGDHSPLVNLIMGMETFNDGQPTWASGLSIRQPLDILAVLAPLSEPLSTTASQSINAYVLAHSAAAHQLDGAGALTRYRESIPRAQILAGGQYAEHFDYLNPTAKTQTVMDAFGISSSAEMAEAKGQAFMAAQAITQGVAQCVSVRLAVGLDTHDDSWLTDHGPALRQGFDALANLISYLKTTTDHNNKPFWERTVLVAASEFSRSPSLNSQFGRDHHLSSSCIVAGAGIRGNQIIGGTDDTYNRLLVNPQTGGTDNGKTLIRPPDLHATVLQALGLNHDHLGNQLPVILEAMLA